MSEHLVDTNVFVYARGGSHPYRDPCRRVLTAVADGAVTLHASVELVQEFAHLLLRRATDREHALTEVEEARSVCRLHDFDAAVWEGATELLHRYPRLGVRDAVHAATALSTGLETVLSTDRVFDGVEELMRVDPADAEAVWNRPSS